MDEQDVFDVRFQPDLSLSRLCQILVQLSQSSYSLDCLKNDLKPNESNLAATKASLFLWLGINLCPGVKVKLNIQHNGRSRFMGFKFATSVRRREVFSEPKFGC